MKTGEYISAALLLIGFTLQVLGTIILDCVHTKNTDSSGEAHWCKAADEIDGIILLIVGMAFLGIYGVAAANEDRLGEFIKVKILTPMRKMKSGQEKVLIEHENYHEPTSTQL